HPPPPARAGPLPPRGTLSATSTLFTPSRMNKNGTFKSSTAAWTQIPNWTPEAGSTVNNHGLVVNGGKTNAVLTANIPWSGQVGFRATMQIRIKVDGAVAFTTTPIETSPLTATINRNVTNGSVVTVEISSNSGDLFQPEVAAGTNTYLSIA
ncbi:hypothetical protein, partial [Nocardia brasiliensis]|uniref:hypothetical protein n=1 Tax=Nocardia brasiliensis TaxID=37326 RepID=UPI0024551ECD